MNLHIQIPKIKQIITTVNTLPVIKNIIFVVSVDWSVKQNHCIIITQLLLSNQVRKMHKNNSQLCIILLCSVIVTGLKKYIINQYNIFCESKGKYLTLFLTIIPDDFIYTINSTSIPPFCVQVLIFRSV